METIKVYGILDQRVQLNCMTKDPITYGMNDQEVVATMLTHLQ